MQTLKDSKLRYHRLFETFQKETLLLDAETEVKPYVNNPFGLLTYSKLNENPPQDLVIPTTVQQMTCVDRLFLFHFDPNPTEEEQEINLAGIDQLPALTENQIQGILSHKNVTNFSSSGKVTRSRS